MNISVIFLIKTVNDCLLQEVSSSMIIVKNKKIADKHCKVGKKH